MADVRQEILEKYGFDIEKIDLIKEYKIPSPDISSKKLEELLAEKRKKWESIIRGTREDKKEAAKEQLSRADAYEAVLRNPALLKALFASGQGRDGAAQFLEFARQYFTIISSSGKIGQSEAQFFFDYYKDRKKNKKAVIQMLEDEFHLPKLTSKTLEKDKEEEENKRKTGKGSRIIVSHFSDQTLFELHRCFRYQEQARQSGKVCQKFPDVESPMDVFLKLDACRTQKDLSAYVGQQLQTVFAYTQEGRHEFEPLRDLFNSLSGLLKQKDVSDNYEKFVFLIRYHKFTPYMQKLMSPKESTLRQLYELEGQSYHFTGFEDFLVKYFIPVYENFGITDDNIKKLLRQAKNSDRGAQQQEHAERSVQKSREASGRKERAGNRKTSERESTAERSKASGSAAEGEKLSFFASLLFKLVNLPFYLSFAVVEAARFLVWNIRYVTVLAAFPIAAMWLPFICYKAMGRGDLVVTVGPHMWEAALNLLSSLFEEAAQINILAVGLLLAILIFLGLVPVGIVTKGLWQAGVQMRKKIDWQGIRRTNEAILAGRRKKFKEKIGRGKAGAMLGLLAAAAVNMALIGGLGYYGKTTTQRIYRRIQIESMMARNRREAKAHRKAQETQKAREAEEASQAADLGTAAITAASGANIRMGAGTDYEVIAVEAHGTILTLTGNTQTLEGGGMWYEVYLDEARTQTGWVNAGIISLNTNLG